MNAICGNMALRPIVNTMSSAVREGFTVPLLRTYSQNSSGSGKNAQDRHVVEFSKKNMKASYANLHARLEKLTLELKVAAVVSPMLSTSWLMLTSQSIFESPVSMACLLAGGAFITNRVMQIYRVKEYAELSATVNPLGFSNVKEVSQIIAGDNPKVQLTLSGMEISGSIGKVNRLSPVVKNTLERIKSMERIVIPTCMVSKRASPLIDRTTDRWISRLSFPFAIFNLIALFNKDPKDWKLDDYVVAASSAHNIYDYSTGPSVGEVRGDLTRYLGEAKTPREVLEKIIDPEDLDGGLSFLKEWSKDVDSLAIRVGRTGEPILYKQGSFSVGGPFPKERFPQKKND
ncbi:MAG: hypothetical protein V4489_05490 [Chlamydiota bacterium]